MPNSLAGRADFTVNPSNAADQIINLDLNVNLNLMNIGDTDGINELQTYTIQAPGNQTITFNNGANISVPLLTKSGGARDVIDALVVAGESTIFAVNAGVLQVGGPNVLSGLNVGVGSGDLKLLTKSGGGTLDLRGTNRVFTDGAFDIRAGTTIFNGLVNRFDGTVGILGGNVNFFRSGGAYSFTSSTAITKDGGGTITFGPDSGSANFLMGGDLKVLNGTVNIGRDGGAAQMTVGAGNLQVSRGTLRLQNGNSSSGVTNVVGGGLLSLTSTSVSGSTISVASTSGLHVGMRVFGPGLPSGATITTVNAGSIVLSVAPQAGSDQVFMVAQGRQGVAATGGPGDTTVTIPSGTGG